MKNSVLTCSMISESTVMPASILFWYLSNGYAGRSVHFESYGFMHMVDGIRVHEI